MRSIQKREFNLQKCSYYSFLLAAVTDASHQVKRFDMKRKYEYIQILLLLDEKKRRKGKRFVEKKERKTFLMT